MGHVREVEREILVVKIVPRRASVRDDLRKLSDALHSATPGRASSYLPSDRTLQMDGGFGDDADWGRRDVVSGAGLRGSDESGGRPSVAEQNDRGRVPVSDQRSCMPVRMRREDRGRPRRVGCARGRRVV